MATFALVDEDNIVVKTIVINNDVITDKNGVEQESLGIDFCNTIFKEKGRWVQTSFNHRFRKQCAYEGYTYDSKADVFIAPQPYASWILNEYYDWVSPLPKPEGYYWWSEENLSWEPMNIES
jgi:hypothetical protein